MGGQGSSDPGRGGDLADAVRPFLRGQGVQPPVVPQPPHVPLDAQEQEAAPEDDARLYRAVEAINLACEQEQERILQKTRTLLARKGIAIEYPQDVNCAVDIALTEEWEGDIDSRLSHLRNLRRYLGTRNCTLWPEIVKALRDLGNPDVPDAGE